MVIWLVCLMILNRALISYHSIPKKPSYSKKLADKIGLSQYVNMNLLCVNFQISKPLKSVVFRNLWKSKWLW